MPRVTLYIRKDDYEKWRKLKAKSAKVSWLLRYIGSNGNDIVIDGQTYKVEDI